MKYLTMFHGCFLHEKYLYKTVIFFVIQNIPQPKLPTNTVWFKSYSIYVYFLRTIRVKLKLFIPLLIKLIGYYYNIRIKSGRKTLLHRNEQHLLGYLSHWGYQLHGGIWLGQDGHWTGRMRGQHIRPLDGSAKDSMSYEPILMTMNVCL